MRNRWMLVVAVAVPLIFTAHAQAEEQSPVSGSVEFIGYRGDFSVWGYAERMVTEKLALSISAAKSKSGFQEIVFGPMYYPMPNMKAGIGVGAAQYTDKEDSRLSLSGFWSWKTEHLETEVLIEKYARDPQPYYRIYAQTPAVGNLAFGIHGEQGIGWGPRISWSLNKNIDLWLATPVIDRAGGDRLIGGLRILF